MLLRAFQNGFTDRDIKVLAAYAISLLLAIGLHEWAHARTADACGDPTPRKQGRLSLNPLNHLDPIGTIAILLAGFGWGKPVQTNPMNYKNLRRDLMLVAVAGPASNLLMAMVGLGLLHGLGAVVGGVPGGAAGPYANIVATLLLLFVVFVHLNLMLMVFNLLPLGPLDGVKVLQWFLPERLAQRFYTASTQFGMLLLIVVIAAPGALSIVHWPVEMIFRLLAPRWLTGQL